MPDARTLYMSDDDSAKYNHKVYNTASGGVLFKFVADVKGDLSAGTLYAARLTQDDTQTLTRPGLTWPGSNWRMDRMIRSPPGSPNTMMSP